MTPKSPTPLSRPNRLLMGMIDAEPVPDVDDGELDDDFERHVEFETRKEVFI